MANLQLQTTSQAGAKQPAIEIAIAEFNQNHGLTIRNTAEFVNWSQKSEQEKMILIKEAIAIVGVTIDAKPPTDPDEILAYDLMINQISRHYPSTTGGEIVQAFELNCTGKEWETIDTYGKIDFKVFGKIMRAYHEYRRKVVREFHIKLAEANKKINQVHKTEEQVQKESYEFIINYFREHGQWPYGDWHNAWIHFWKLNRLKRADVEPWFEAESRKIVDGLLQRRKVETNELQVQSINLLLQPEAVKAECRRRYLQMTVEKNMRDEK